MYLGRVTSEEMGTTFIYYMHFSLFTVCLTFKRKMLWLQHVFESNFCWNSTHLFCGPADFTKVL